MSAPRTLLLALTASLLAACGSVSPSSTIPSPTDHAKGPENAPIQIVEYADFQCPACGLYAPVIEETFEKNKDSMRIAFRQFPLESIHQHAVLAAEAAEAAAVQGKFWEMHDKLFATQQDWSALPDPTETFVGYATAIGCDPAQFRTALTKHTYRAQVRASASRAMAAGINATPTMFINGEKMVIPRSAAEFQAIIDAKLRSSVPAAPMLQTSSAPAVPAVPAEALEDSAPSSAAVPSSVPAAPAP